MGVTCFVLSVRERDEEGDFECVFVFPEPCELFLVDVRTLLLLDELEVRLFARLDTLSTFLESNAELLICKRGVSLSSCTCVAYTEVAVEVSVVELLRKFSVLFFFEGAFFTILHSEVYPCGIILRLFVTREVSIRESDGGGKTALVGDVFLSVFCLLFNLVQLVTLLAIEEPFDFATTRILPLSVTWEFFREFDVNNSGGDEEAGRDGVGESMKLSNGSPVRVALTIFVELNEGDSEGDSEGVGRPNSEKSVPKICLTSDDRRSLLCSEDCLDFRLFASRGLFRALGSNATLEFPRDSSVPRSDN